MQARIEQARGKRGEGKGVKKQQQRADDKKKRQELAKANQSKLGLGPPSRSQGGGGKSQADRSNGPPQASSPAVQMENFSDIQVS